MGVATTTDAAAADPVQRIVRVDHIDQNFLFCPQVWNKETLAAVRQEEAFSDTQREPGDQPTDASGPWTETGASGQTDGHLDSFLQAVD